MNQKARAEPLPYMWNLFPLILFLKELHLIMDGLLLVAIKASHSFNHQRFSFRQAYRFHRAICQLQKIISTNIQS